MLCVLIFAVCDVTYMHACTTSSGSSSTGAHSAAGPGHIANGRARVVSHSTVILFVYGGVTCAELREIREAFVGRTLKQNIDLIVLSTSILTPALMYNTLLQMK